jgi:hypothetical protein
MSIRETAAEEARQRQNQQIEARHSKEAEARPDAMHRAVVFCLRQIALNNRDASREVAHHIETLDKELGNPEKVAQLEPAPAGTPATASEGQQPATADAAPPANTIKTSRRFQRSKE